jgi:hypothetical protein
MQELPRSHRFTVEIDGSELGVMSVTGLAPRQPDGSKSVVRITRALCPPYDYLRSWVRLADWRNVRVTLLESRPVYVGSGHRTVETAGNEPVMTFEFSARPKTYYYSELDAGSNRLFTENIQLQVELMKITSNIMTDDGQPCSDSPEDLA